VLARLQFRVLVTEQLAAKHSILVLTHEGIVAGLSRLRASAVRGRIASADHARVHLPKRGVSPDVSHSS